MRFTINISTSSCIIKRVDIKIFRNSIMHTDIHNTMNTNSFIEKGGID